MKKTGLFLVVLLMLAGTVSAQMPSKPFNIYAGGGMTLPNSPDDFKDTYNNGFHAIGGLGMVMGPAMQLVGKIGYHRMAMDFDNFIDPDADGGELTILTYGADFRFALGLPAAPLKPFAFGGAGYANLKFADLESTAFGSESVTETKFYFNVGGGIEFKMGPMTTFFIQGTYLSISTDDIYDESLVSIPVTIGIKF